MGTYPRGPPIYIYDSYSAQIRGDLLQIDSLFVLQEDITKHPCLAGNSCPKALDPERWGSTLCILLSSPHYLNLAARCSCLAGLMEAGIPADEIGLSLEVMDWHSPLLGACLALGVDLYI
jgi:hypothetical protein